MVYSVHTCHMSYLMMMIIFEYSGEAAAGLYQSCEFEGQTSWVRKRGVSDAYRHAQIAKSFYGLGTIVTIFADMDQ